jgi:uncharacterized protein YbjT (DUF2867 family)
MKALLLGSTGLVGTEILKLLVKDPAFQSVHLIGRRETSFDNPKIVFHQMDMENIDSIPQINADVLFIAFGTTLKTAGSKERQAYIDVEIPTKIMKLAFEQGTRKCALVSAVGVSEKSPFFYSRMKAKLDQNAREIGFDHLVLVKPSVLDGNRKEKRSGEKWSIILGNLIGKTGLINAYRPVKVEHVAAAMINQITLNEKGNEEISNTQIPKLANHYFKMKH